MSLKVLKLLKGYKVVRISTVSYSYYSLSIKLLTLCPLVSLSGHNNQ